MMTIRQSLQLDALASGGLGVLLIALAGIADDRLGLPTALSLGVGAFLLAWAGFCAWAGARQSIGLTREVALLNIGWVAASVVFLVAGWVELTTLGEVFVVLQALAVVGFIVLQLGAVRREPVAA